MDMVCRTCRYADEGVCANCKGVDGQTEIVETGYCENYKPAMACDRTERYEEKYDRDRWWVH